MDAPGRTVRRCLFKHQWVVKKAFFAESRVPYSYVWQVLPRRTCERCGTVQRGRYDTYSGKITWETMRERVYIEPKQLQIVRRPSSRLDQWAHALGLRQSRMRDKERLGKRPKVGRL